MTFIFPKYWLLLFVFQKSQLSDEAIYAHGEPSFSGELPQGKFADYCIMNLVLRNK